MKNLMKVLQYAKNYKGYAAMNVVFNLLSIFFSLFSLTMLIPFLDLIFLQSSENHQENVASGLPELELSTDSLRDTFSYYFSEFILSDPENGQINALIFICVLIVIMIFFKNLFRYLALFVMAELRNGILRDLRQQVYHKLILLPNSYFSEERKGDILSRMSSDVKEIEWTILRSIEMLFRDPMSLLVFLAAMLIMSAKLTLFVFLMLPLTSVVIGRVGKSLKKTSAKGQQKVGYITSLIEETLGGLSVIKSFNAQEFIKNRFDTHNNRYKNIMVRMYRKSDLASPLSEFLGVFILVIVIWFGGKLVLNDSETLSASVFIAYIVIFSQIIPPAKSFTTAYYNLQKGAASADRINEILDAEERIVNAKNPKQIKNFMNSISFKEVEFDYDGGSVLQGISFSIKKGEKVALVGASGSGKTTIANLLPRFYDIKKGEILLDDIPIENIRISDLRHLIGYVNQNPILFNDSIVSNIAFGETQPNREKVIEAAKVANAHDFIQSFEQGYNTEIGDSGGKLSGGQRQRISIARAVYKNAPILILDEATSSLDTESEKWVQDALNKLMSNRTSLIIAHRLSTIKNADRILVISQGKIVESGKHEELLEKSGVYQKLYEIQTFN